MQKDAIDIVLEIEYRCVFAGYKAGILATLAIFFTYLFEYFAFYAKD